MTRRKPGDQVRVRYGASDETPWPLVPAEVMTTFQRRGCSMHVVEIYVDHEVGHVYEVYPASLVYRA